MPKSERIPARVEYKARRMAVQWIQEEYPARWEALIQEAWANYVPKSFADCPHDKIRASAIMRQCVNCGMFLGAWSVENENNKEFLQEILEAEGGAG